jgi:hypothetical protein
MAASRRAKPKKRKVDKATESFLNLVIKVAAMVGLLLQRDIANNLEARVNKDITL